MPIHSLHWEPAALCLPGGWCLLLCGTNPGGSSPSLSSAFSKANMQLKHEGPGLITPKSPCQSQEEAGSTLGCRELCSLKAVVGRPCSLPARCRYLQRVQGHVGILVVHLLLDGVDGIFRPGQGRGDTFSGRSHLLLTTQQSPR